MSKIGFIGLGRMGKGMASNLQRKGFGLMVLDINPAPVAELVALGAQAAADVKQIAQASANALAHALRQRVSELREAATAAAASEPGSQRAKILKSPMLSDVI